MPKPLAEIVIDAGLAGRSDVVAAAKIADERKLPLIAALVRHGGVDELGLVAAIRKQVRLPVIDPASIQHDPDALRELPREVCRRLRVLPIGVAAYDSGPRILRLAMADPTDPVTLAEVEHVTGCEVEAMLMPLSAIEEMVENSYRAFVTAVMPREPAAASRETSASTTPYHRVSDEADLALRHRALLELLVKKQLISESDYEAEVRALMKRRAADP